MATVGRWVTTGLSLWLAELKEIVPHRWKRTGQAHQALSWDGADSLTLPGGEKLGSTAHGPVVKSRAIRIPRSICLQRTLDLPRLSARDLDNLLALDADRIMPFPAEDMMIAGASGRATPESGKAPVQIAALPRFRAEQLAALLKRYDIHPSAILVEDSAVDLLPAFRRSGLLAAKANPAAPWMVLALFLFACNVGILIWRDMASVERLRDEVEAQRPAAMIAQRKAQQLQRSDALVQTVMKRRARHVPLRALEIVTRAMPAQAWVQRYNWNGDAIRLSGYKAKGVDLLKALRANPLIVEARNVSVEDLAEIPAGQPFDVILRVAP